MDTNGLFNFMVNVSKVQAGHPIDIHNDRDYWDANENRFQDAYVSRDDEDDYELPKRNDYDDYL